jgi:hypothetical protein
LSPEELSERNKRMKRAIDLSLKHTYLAHDVQKAEGTPYRSYLELDEVRHAFHSCMPHSLYLTKQLHCVQTTLLLSHLFGRFEGISRNAWRTSRCRIVS